MILSKKISVFLLIMVLLGLTACTSKATVNMDQPAEDGKFYYSSDLGFKVTFGKEFLYYQTQRRALSNGVLVEFFVPTSDISAHIQIPGYARFAQVYVLNSDESEEDKNNYDSYFTVKDKFFGLKFWNNIPYDWIDKWNDSVKGDIIQSFKQK